VAKVSPLTGEVGSNAVWRGAQWVALTPATRETRSLPPTHVACVYDADNLYVAFAGVKGAAKSSTVSVWLDSSAKQNGTELMEISAEIGELSGTSPTAVTTQAIWHRCVSAPETREAPDFSIPMDHIRETANYLKVNRGKGTVEGKEAWTLVLAIPFKSLHFPQTVTPAAGFNWRFNLLRQDKIPTGSGPDEMVQANLSPVHAGAQKVMPYRMATMTLSKNVIGVVAPVKPTRVALSR
jgi:hypothetical protein